MTSYGAWTDARNITKIKEKLAQLNKAQQKRLSLAPNLIGRKPI